MTAPGFRVRLLYGVFVLLLLMLFSSQCVATRGVPESQTVVELGSNMSIPFVGDSVFGKPAAVLFERQEGGILPSWIEIIPLPYEVALPVLLLESTIHCLAADRRYAVIGDNVGVDIRGFSREEELVRNYGKFATDDNVVDIAIVEDRLVVLVEGKGLLVLDISNNLAIVQIGSTLSTHVLPASKSDPVGLAIVEDLAIVADKGGFIGAFKYKTTPPQKVQIVSQYSFAFVGVTYFSGVAHLAYNNAPGTQGILFADINPSSLAAPITVVATDVMPTAAPVVAVGIRETDGFMAVTTATGIVFFYNYVGAKNFQLCGTLPNAFGLDVSFAAGMAIIADGANVLYVDTRVCTTPMTVAAAKGDWGAIKLVPVVGDIVYAAASHSVSFVSISETSLEGTALVNSLGTTRIRALPSCTGCEPFDFSLVVDSFPQLSLGAELDSWTGDPGDSAFVKYMQSELFYDLDMDTLVLTFDGPDFLDWYVNAAPSALLDIGKTQGFDVLVSRCFSPGGVLVAVVVAQGANGTTMLFLDNGAIPSPPVGAASVVPPPVPGFAAHIDEGGLWIKEVVLAGRRLLATGSLQLVLVEFSDSCDALKVAYTMPASESIGTIVDVAVFGDEIAIVSRDHLTVWDFGDDFSAPAKTAEVAGQFSGAVGVELTEEAVVVATDQAIIIYDRATSPLEYATVYEHFPSGTNQINQVILREPGLLYVADSKALYSVDMTQLYGITSVAQLPLPSRLFATVGNILVVFSDPKASLFDISDSSTFRPVGDGVLIGSPRGISSLTSLVYYIDYKTNWVVAFDTGPQYVTGAVPEGAAGNYMLTICATDAAGANISISSDIIVRGPPLLATPLPNHYAKVGQTFSYFIEQGTFVDPNADPLNMELMFGDLSQLPAGYWLRFGGTSGTFIGVPAKAENIDFVVRASDQFSGFADGPFSIAVDYAPTVVAPLGRHSADVGSIFRVDVSTSFADKDGDELTYTLEMRDGTQVPNFINFYNGELFILVEEDFVGVYNMTVTADDGHEGTVSSAMTIDIEHYPVVRKPFSAQAANPGSRYQFAIDPLSYFDDADGDAISIAVAANAGHSFPQWLSYNTLTGSLSGVPRAADAGLVNLTVTAYDGRGGAVTSELVINVHEFPHAPRNLVPDRAANVGSDFSLVFPGDQVVSDFKPLTFSARLADSSSLPPWLVFDNETLEFTGMAEDVFLAQIVVEFVDCQGGNFHSGFAIDFEHYPVAVHQIPDYVVSVGSPLEVDISTSFFEDQDVSDTLYLTVTTASGSALPNWLTYKRSRELLYGTPSLTDIGKVAISVYASDMRGGGVTEKFSIDVVRYPLVASVGKKASQPFNVSLPLSLCNATIGCTASDGDGGPIPLWMDLVSVGGAWYVQGRPEDGHVGAFVVRITSNRTEEGTADVVTNFVIKVYSNSAPLVANPIANVMAEVKEDFMYVVPAGTFVDPDSDRMSLTASLEEGPLPVWLEFNVENNMFVGQPMPQHARMYRDTEYSIKLTATDGLNETSTFFKLTLTGASTVETIINYAVTIVSFGGSVWGFYGKRHHYWNFLKKKKYQRPKETFAAGSGRYCHFIKLANSWEIGTIVASVEQKTKIAGKIGYTTSVSFPGGTLLPEWLKYSAATNCLYSKRGRPGSREMGQQLTISVIHYDKRILEEFVLEITPPVTTDTTPSEFDSTIEQLEVIEPAQVKINPIYTESAVGGRERSRSRKGSSPRVAGMFAGRVRALGSFRAVQQRRSTLRKPDPPPPVVFPTASL